jgi:hypothetical protein
MIRTGFHAGKSGMSYYQSTKCIWHALHTPHYVLYALICKIQNLLEIYKPPVILPISAALDEGCMPSPAMFH